MTDGALCGSGAGARLPCAQTSRDRREQHAASRGDWRTRVSDYVHGHARLAELQAGTGNHPPKFLLPGSAAPDDAGGLNATSTCARSDSIDREHHDTRGNLLTIKDERHTSANTIYTYDFLNRLKTVTQKQVLTPGPDVVTQYAYDVQDNLTSVTDPNGNVTTYGYDDFRRMQRQSSPVTGVTSYSYDAAGNLVSSTDANTATTTRVYDAINRMTSATSTRAGLATETVTWTFDAATAGNYGMGRVATMTDPTGSTTFAYERRGLLRSEASPASVVGGTSTTGTITLTGAAPAAGTVVTLSSSKTSVAAPPSSVTVVSAATTAIFAVPTTTVVSSTSVTLTASFGGADQEGRALGAAGTGPRAILECGLGLPCGRTPPSQPATRLG